MEWSVCTACRLGVICKRAQSKSAYVRQAAHVNEGDRPSSRNKRFADGCNVCLGCQSAGGMDLWDGASTFYRSGSDYTKVTIKPRPSKKSSPALSLDSDGRIRYAKADPLASTVSYQQRSKSSGKGGSLPSSFLTHVYLQSATAMDNSAALPSSIQCCKVDCSSMLKWNEMMSGSFPRGWIAARKTNAPPVSLYVGDMEGPCCLLCANKKNKSAAAADAAAAAAPAAAAPAQPWPYQHIWDDEQKLD